jgi:hypothetical protein
MTDHRTLNACPHCDGTGLVTWEDASGITTQTCAHCCNGKARPETEERS